MASSILPLYSAALGLSEFSVFLGVTFSGTISAGLGSAGFDSAPAPAAASFDCGEASVPAGLPQSYPQRFLPPPATRRASCCPSSVHHEVRAPPQRPVLFCSLHKQ